MVEGARLEAVYIVNNGARVRISPLPRAGVAQGEELSEGVLDDRRLV